MLRGGGGCQRQACVMQGTRARRCLEIAARARAQPQVGDTAAAGSRTAPRRRGGRHSRQHCRHNAHRLQIGQPPPELVGGGGKNAQGENKALQGSRKAGEGMPASARAPQAGACSVYRQQAAGTRAPAGRWLASGGPPAATRGCPLTHHPMLKVIWRQLAHTLHTATCTRGRGVAGDMERQAGPSCRQGWICHSRRAQPTTRLRLSTKERAGLAKEHVGWLAASP